VRAGTARRPGPPGLRRRHTGGGAVRRDQVEIDRDEIHLAPGEVADGGRGNLAGPEVGPMARTF
jgi:hypothetical protein